MTSDDIVLVFTDIHADIAAIKSIFKCAASSEFISRFGTVNRVINLGDVVGRGYFPAEAIDFIQNLDLEVVSLLGNHDESVMYNWPVAGDDSLASKIHDEFKKKGEYSDYFKDLKEVYID
ncbi:MAG: metallophosphoesterase, partial [Thermoplasmata archaeon]